jgi:hypothetical protein
MSCFVCRSANQSEFPTKMVVHFQGQRNLKKVGVWLFPKVLVCLNCGYSRFTVPETELPFLTKSAEANRTATQSQSGGNVP